MRFNGAIIISRGEKGVGGYCYASWAVPAAPSASARIFSARPAMAARSRAPVSNRRTRSEIHRSSGRTLCFAPSTLWTEGGVDGGWWNRRVWVDRKWYLFPHTHTHTHTHTVIRKEQLSHLVGFALQLGKQAVRHTRPKSPADIKRERKKKGGLGGGGVRLETERITHCIPTTKKSHPAMAALEFVVPATNDGAAGQGNKGKR